MSEPQLLMRRAELDDLPGMVLPDGYTVHRCERVFAESEGAGIAQVLGEAFPGMAWSGQKVTDTFIGDAGCIATFYLRHGETIVATATARRDPAFSGVGYVHWVGVSEAHRGNRLGYHVSLAVLHEFAQEGLTGAVLTTDDHRLAAIQTYRRLGFVPEFAHPSHEERWRRVSP
ncbi:MAG: GNAT family N-acetyltransferase [Armatimonadetes bacterium]|nr:GNAT family N-acetyltransferase [Armatimonadota bacterium]